MYLTKSKAFIIGPAAIALGFLMNLIYNGQCAVGWDNIGLCIILFTIVVYMLMTPLTVQQQKFSKLQAKMNPELQAIQKKYKGKNSDQAAMAKMNEETQAIYAKYGVNPMGSCLQMVIQLPILFALYRVIWNIPAYLDKVKALFMPLANALLETAGAEETMAEFAKTSGVSFKEFSVNSIIDVLNKLKPANWEALAQKFPDLSTQIADTRTNLNRVNTFLGGLDIADAPLNIIRTAWQNKAIVLLIAAILIPLLAALTQWLNAKLMTSATDNKGNEDEAPNQMNQTMKTMNTIMPIMSAVFCLSLPVGLGIYWIISAVVRSVQQVVINKQLDKIDIDELAAKNMEKLNAKRAKQGLPPEKMNANAHISTKNIDNGPKYGVSASKRAELQKKAGEIDSSSVRKESGSSVRPGSLAAKANMVKEYNDKHGKK